MARRAARLRDRNDDDVRRRHAKLLHRFARAGDVRVEVVVDDAQSFAAVVGILPQQHVGQLVQAVHDEPPLALERVLRQRAAAFEEGVQFDLHALRRQFLEQVRGHRVDRAALLRRQVDQRLERRPAADPDHEQPHRQHQHGCDREIGPHPERAKLHATLRALKLSVVRNRKNIVPPA